MNMKKVLAGGAHPDDVEILCGGILARYADQGVNVTILTVTNGEKGSLDKPPESVVEIRNEECKLTAAVIGADWFSPGVPDRQVAWNEQLHIAMIQAIQQADPDVIITHPSNDYASDHVETSKAVVNTSFYTPCPQFTASDGNFRKKVAPVYFMDTACGVGFEPVEYVDITDTLSTKLDMLSKHASQYDYLEKRDGMDFAELIRTSARYRGFQCGCKFAEAFRPYNAWPRLQTKRILP